MSPTAQKIVRVTVATIMIALLVLYMRGVDWGQIADAAAGASVLLLVISVAGNLPLIYFKAARLRLLVGGRVETPRLMGMYVASYAADNLLMSQAGLGVRVAMLVQEDVPLAGAVTSQAVEKVLEAIGLAILSVPLLLTLDLEPRLAHSLRWCLVAGAVAACVLATVAIVWRRRLQVVQRVADALAPLRDPAQASRMMVLTMAAWAVEIAIALAAMWAMHVDAPMIAAPTLVLLAVNLAALVPGLPANVGQFEMACVLALSTFGVSAEQALAFGLVYHALHTIPVTIVGLPGLARITRMRKAVNVEA